MYSSFCTLTCCGHQDVPNFATLIINIYPKLLSFTQVYNYYYMTNLDNVLVLDVQTEYLCLGILIDGNFTSSQNRCKYNNSELRYLDIQSHD